MLLYLLYTWCLRYLGSAWWAVYGVVPFYLGTCGTVRVGMELRPPSAPVHRCTWAAGQATYHRHTQVTLFTCLGIQMSVMNLCRELFRALSKVMRFVQWHVIVCLSVCLFVCLSPPSLSKQMETLGVVNSSLNRCTTYKTGLTTTTTYQYYSIRLESQPQSITHTNNSSRPHKATYVFH